MNKRHGANGKFSAESAKWADLRLRWINYPMEGSLADFGREVGEPYSTLSKKLKRGDRLAHQLGGGGSVAAMTDSLIAECWQVLKRSRLSATMATALLPRLLAWQEKRGFESIEKQIAGARRGGAAMVARLVADGMHQAGLCAPCRQAFRVVFMDLLARAEKGGQEAQDWPGGDGECQGATEATQTDPVACGAVSDDREN